LGQRTHPAYKKPAAILPVLSSKVLIWGSNPSKNNPEKRKIKQKLKVVVVVVVASAAVTVTVAVSAVYYAGRVGTKYNYMQVIYSGLSVNCYTKM